MGFQLLLHELVQHFLRKKRLLVAKGLPDEDQGGDGLPPGVKPEGIQGVQRLLGGLVERQVKQVKAEGADNLMDLLLERAAERYQTLEIQDEELQTEKMKEALKGISERIR